MIIFGAIIQLVCLLFFLVLANDLVKGAWLGWRAGKQSSRSLVAAICMASGGILVVGSTLATDDVAAVCTVVGILLIAVFFSYHVIRRVISIFRGTTS